MFPSSQTNLEDHVEVAVVLEGADEVDEERKVDSLENLLLVDGVLHLLELDHLEEKAHRTDEAEGNAGGAAAPSPPQTLAFSKIFSARKLSDTFSLTSMTRPKLPVPSVQTGWKSVRFGRDCWLVGWTNRKGKGGER